MHNPTVCLLFHSQFSHHPVAHRHEPLFRCFSQTPQNCSERNHPSRTFSTSLNRRSLSTCRTQAGRVQTEVFHWSPAVRETCCVTFLVNRHRLERERKGKGGWGLVNSLLRYCLKKKVNDMVLIKSYAEWQNHCSFYAVVVSVACEGQVEKCREKE